VSTICAVSHHWKINHKPKGEPTSDHDQDIDDLAHEGDQDIEDVRPVQTPISSSIEQASVFAVQTPTSSSIEKASVFAAVQTPISSSIEQASVLISKNERTGELWRMRRVLMAQKLQIEQQLQRIDAELDFHHNVQWKQ
jgi:hypothetical protein